jgi:hypothetical protein
MVGRVNTSSHSEKVNGCKMNVATNIFLLVGNTPSMNNATVPNVLCSNCLRN